MTYKDFYADLLVSRKQRLMEGGKLFSPLSNRVTNEEMNQVFDELKSKLSKKFHKFSLSPSLPSKKDHGDIDIVVLSYNGESVRNAVLSLIQDSIEKNNETLFVNSNGNIFSVLYNPDNLKKKVHIDFIAATSEEDFKNKMDFLSSGVYH